MRREEGEPRLGGFDVGVFFSDSYNSPAYRVSSTGVVFKPSRGAAALSSAAALTGRFISPEICTDHTSLMANCQSVSRSCRALSSITLPPPHPSSPFLFLHLLLLLLQGQETFFFSSFFSRSDAKHYRCCGGASQKTRKKNGIHIHLSLSFQTFLTRGGNKE